MKCHLIYSVSLIALSVACGGDDDLTRQELFSSIAKAERNSEELTVNGVSISSFFDPVNPPRP
jgi:hypothetical protein